MLHYVYYSYEEWGRGYIGVRSCKCPPEEDNRYFGSFYDKTFKPTEKIILEVYDTRVEALQAEIDLHSFYEVHKNSHFANRAKQLSTGFDNRGKGIEACLLKYPDFPARGGRVGGRVTHQRHPHLAKENGRKGFEKGLKKWMEANPNWVEMFTESRMKGVAYFQNNPEAAKARGRNGVKAMQDYWRENGPPKGKPVKVRVKLPTGEQIVFNSFKETVEHMNIPATSLKRVIDKGPVTRGKYKGYEFTRLPQD